MVVASDVDRHLYHERHRRAAFCRFAASSSRVAGRQYGSMLKREQHLGPKAFDLMTCLADISGIGPLHLRCDHRDCLRVIQQYLDGACLYCRQQVWDLGCDHLHPALKDTVCEAVGGRGIEVAVEAHHSPFGRCHQQSGMVLACGGQHLLHYLFKHAQVIHDLRFTLFPRP